MIIGVEEGIEFFEETGKLCDGTDEFLSCVDQQIEFDKPLLLLAVCIVLLVGQAIIVCATSNCQRAQLIQIFGVGLYQFTVHIQVYFLDEDRFIHFLQSFSDFLEQGDVAVRADDPVHCDQPLQDHKHTFDLGVCQVVEEYSGCWVVHCQILFGFDVAEKLNDLGSVKCALKVFVVVKTSQVFVKVVFFEKLRHLS